MGAKLWILAVLLASCLGASACGVLVGAGGAVAADEVAEDDGDDGLF